MPVTRVGTESDGDSTGVGVTDMSWSHTAPAGASLITLCITMQGDETISGLPTFDSDDFTLIDDSGSGTSGEQRTWIYGFAAPAAKTANIAFTTSGQDFCGCGGINWAGTATASVAAATNQVDAVNTTTNEITCILSSGGSSGNALLGFAGWRGGDTDPFSASGSFAEIWDRATGTDASSDTGHCAYELFSGLPSGLTITSSLADQNAGVLIELVAAATGAMMNKMMQEGHLNG